MTSTDPKPELKARPRPILAVVAILVPLIAYIVWSSFQVSAWACEVCMGFEGRETCRTVTGATRREVLRTGIDNACALLTSGMTRTLRCSRTPPLRTECRRL